MLEKRSRLEFAGLLPSKEFTSLEGDHWFLFNPGQIGITVIGMEDLNTGLTLTSELTNPEIRTASLKAWAGARHSRSPNAPWDILKEIHDKDVDPDKKMGQMFADYGHASVADMASLQVDFVDAPMHLCFQMFALSAINSGQEKSTRYQGDFSKTELHPIEHYLPSMTDSKDLLLAQSEYQKLADQSLDIYARNKT